MGTLGISQLVNFTPIGAQTGGCVFKHNARITWKVIKNWNQIAVRGQEALRTKERSTASYFVGEVTGTRAWPIDRIAKRSDITAHPRFIVRGGDVGSCGQNLTTVLLFVGSLVVGTEPSYADYAIPFEFESQWRVFVRRPNIDYASTHRKSPRILDHGDA